MGAIRAGFLWGLISLFAPLCGWSADLAIPSLSGPVIDLTGTLSEQQKSVLENTSNQIWDQKRGQIQILLIPTLDSESIEGYANQVFHHWQLGQKGDDNGILILVAIKEHKVRIEVGRGLEGVIPDIIAKQITADHMVPAFKQGHFFEGLQTGVQLVQQRISGKNRNLSQSPSKTPSFFNDPFFWVQEPWALFLFLILLSILCNYLGNKYVDVLGSRREKSDSNSASSDIGSSSGSNISSSSESWSGGGGDSSGGGASSSW